MIPHPTPAERRPHRATQARLASYVPEPCVFAGGVCTVRERLKENVEECRTKVNAERRRALRMIAVDLYHEALRELAGHSCDMAPGSTA